MADLLPWSEWSIHACRLKTMRQLEDVMMADDLRSLIPMLLSKEAYTIAGDALALAQPLAGRSPTSAVEAAGFMARVVHGGRSRNGNASKPRPVPIRRQGRAGEGSRVDPPFLRMRKRKKMLDKRMA